MFLKRYKSHLIISTIFILIVFSNPFLANLAISTLEFPRNELENEKSYDMGILLTGMTDPKGLYPGANFESGSDRLIEAIALYQRGIIQKLTISGGSGQIIGEYSEAEVLGKTAIQLGVDPGDLIIEGESRNTYENAIFTSRILKTDDKELKLLLITSSFHMKRSLLCFDKAGLMCDAYPTDFRSKKFEGFGELVFPNIGSMEVWKTVFHEIFGMIYYHLAGYT